MSNLEAQTVTWLFSFAMICVSIYSNYKNSKHTDNTDVDEKIKEAKREAAEMATINVKLDEIGKDTKDIKYDITSVKETQQSQEKDIVKIDQSCRSAHHRIDYIENKLNIQIPKELKEN